MGYIQGSQSKDGRQCKYKEAQFQMLSQILLHGPVVDLINFHLNKTKMCNMYKSVHCQIPGFLDDPSFQEERGLNKNLAFFSGHCLLERKDHLKRLLQILYSYWNILSSIKKKQLFK